VSPSWLSSTVSATISHLVLWYSVRTNVRPSSVSYVHTVCPSSVEPSVLQHTPVVQSCGPKLWTKLSYSYPSLPLWGDRVHCSQLPYSYPSLLLWGDRFHCYHVQGRLHCGCPVARLLPRSAILRSIHYRPSSCALLGFALGLC
jgi:hypothetical protein